MSLWEIFFYGFIIGIVVSAPIGPVGILVIQRTLSRGRAHGFVTGLGIALSDVIYALMVLMGMSVVTDFLEKEAQALKFIGGILMLVLGYMLFKSNPMKVFQPKAEEGTSRYSKDFVSSFLLTFSNAAIIFLFIALFSRFNYVPSEMEFKFVMASLLSIALGATTWWYVITTYVAKLQKYINRRGLVIMNRLLGGLLFAIGIIGILLSIFR